MTAAGESDARIVRARVFSIDAPLRTPYVLSFATLHAYRARLVEVELEDGRKGLGEVVALPGYGDETDDDVAAAHEVFARSITDMPAEDARASIAAHAGARPFAASAVLAALDVATGALAVPASIDHPLVAAIATDEPDRMLAAIAERAEAGCRTIKVKLGVDAGADVRAIPPLLDGLADAAPGVTIRFDANQAYDEPQARRVLAAFDHPRKDAVELLEQPLGTADADWDAFARLVPASPIPLMLDESIETADDVDRAADAGAAWIKLKACKGAGVRELHALAARAKGHGLNVVLGNGVATDVANGFEACVRAMRPELFDGAGEDNGFAKLERPLLAHPPRLAAGSLAWSPLARPFTIAGERRAVPSKETRA